jgi:hypothetical protein
MAVTPRSRYYGLPVIEAPDARGVRRPTLAMRLLPPARGPFFQHPVTGLQSLEYLAWKSTGQSDLWWRIADANPVRFPLDYRPGEPVQISADPQVGVLQRQRR